MKRKLNDNNSNVCSLRASAFYCIFYTVFFFGAISLTLEVEKAIDFVMLFEDRLQRFCLLCIDYILWDLITCQWHCVIFLIVYISTTISSCLIYRYGAFYKSLIFPFSIAWFLLDPLHNIGFSLHISFILCTLFLSLQCPSLQFLPSKATVDYCIAVSSSALLNSSSAGTSQFGNPLDRVYIVVLLCEPDQYIFCNKNTKPSQPSFIHPPSTQKSGPQLSQRKILLAWCFW